MTTIERGQTPAGTPASDADIGFVPEGMSVDVRAKTEKLWELLATFEYRAAHDLYVVTAGEITDFASVPRVFVWFIPSYGLYTKAAILHDVLCRLADDGKFSRRDADGIFRQAMRILGVAFLRRWVMWVAVRWGALVTRRAKGLAEGRVGRAADLTTPHAAAIAAGGADFCRAGDLAGAGVAGVGSAAPGDAREGSAPTRQKSELAGADAQIVEI